MAYVTSETPAGPTVTTTLDDNTVRSPSRTAGPLVVVLLFAVIGLLWAKWWPYTEKTTGLLDSRSWEGDPLADTALAAATWWEAGWDFTFVYTAAVWKALLVALVMAAAIEAILGPERLGTLLRGGRTGTHRETARAAVAGLPTMMCTCCAAPVVVGLRRAGTSASAAAAFWLANPVLNPAVIVFLLLVGPWQWSAVRVVLGILLVAGCAAAAWVLVDRNAAGAAASRPSPAPPAVRRPATAGMRHVLAAALLFVRRFSRFLVTLLPEYLILVFAVGALTHVTGWTLADVDWTTTALLVFALVAVAFVIPTGGEIPVLLALAAAGAGPWAIGVALMCLSAVSIPSLAMIGRALAWRVAGVIVLLVVAGVLAGALLSL